MTPLELALEKRLRTDEGEKLKVYPDSKGHPTIGVGRALDRKGITETESAYLLYGDILDVQAEATKAFPWYPLLSDSRKVVILSMLFQLGLAGVQEFEQMIEAVGHQNWSRAAAEMRASKWHAETPARAERLAAQMETGVMQA